MADTSSLTQRQREIYDYIRESIAANGFAPAIREIGNAFNISSPNGVMCHLRALEKKGLIKRKADLARAICIDDVRPASVPLNARPATVKMLGLVAAGSPIEAEEQAELLDIGDLFVGDNHFALRVTGTSMIEDHIDDGDYVIIRKQERAENGERVVAKIDGEYTLKRYKKTKDAILLIPANSAMQTIVVSPDSDVEIIGVLVGVLRRC